MPMALYPVVAIYAACSCRASVHHLLPATQSLANNGVQNEAHIGGYMAIYHYGVGYPSIPK